MAYTDSLFQLGMDLTRSSTAQKEDHAQAARLAHDEATNAPIARHPTRTGTHLIIDLLGAERLDDLQHIEETLKRCVAHAGARLLQIHLHRFLPNGSISGVAVLEDGHISLHSWPHARSASLHVFTGGDAAPRQSVAALKEAFSPAKAVVRQHLGEARAGRGTGATRKTHGREKAQQAA
jgi:S-adenosylmethionine decarboxylase